MEKDQKENENKNVECKFDSKRRITTCTIGKRVCCRSGRSNFLCDAHHLRNWRRSCSQEQGAVGFSPADGLVVV